MIHGPLVKSVDGRYVLYADHLVALALQSEEWRDNKRYLENDLALKMEQIAGLTAENKQLKEKLEDEPVRGRIPTLDEMRELLNSKELADEREDWRKVSNAQTDLRQNLMDMLIEKDKQITALTAELEAWKSTFGTSQLTHAQAQLERLTTENKRLRTMSTVEMMCENYNVKCHVEEWEARCLKAEAENKRLRKEITKLHAFWEWSHIPDRKLFEQDWEATDESTCGLGPTPE